MAGEDGPQLRAWVDYFRDLGIHDFYRRGEFAGLSATDVDAGSSIQIEASVPAVSTVGGGHVVAAGGQPFAEEVALAPQDASTSPASQTMKLISFNNLAPLPAEPVPAAHRAAALVAIQEAIGDCTRCPLAYAGRHKIVFGDGAAMARLMFVGEGPGADEDAQGIPFVGKAGQLLNNMIAAMGLARADVYIANIVKCRPPGNRVPEPVEANTCSQFLLRQIDVVQPEVIVALGATAAMYLLGVKQSLSGLRGRWHACRGAKLAVTYHPAFLLRDPRQKAEAWKDLQMVMAELGLTAPARK
jgi:uracil-DNA glycosylase family 4